MAVEDGLGGGVQASHSRVTGLPLACHSDNIAIVAKWVKISALRLFSVSWNF